MTRTTLGIDLDADARGVDAGVDRAKRSFGGLSTAAKAGGLAIAAGLAIGAKALFDYGNAAIDLASDQAETVNKSRVIFGQLSEGMEKWAQTAYRTAGLSKSAALGAAAAFGDMFQQLGYGRGEAARTSRDVVQLAADLGSFHNLDTADVLDRISAGFRGEYDSLQALIPAITAARVEQQAMTMTGKENADALTAQEKAQATLAIITKDGAKAQGDFARTSDDLANKTKIVNAQLENQKAALGEKLLPIKLAFYTLVSEKVIPAVQRLGRFLERELGPAFRRVARWIGEHVIPAARRFYDWFIDRIVPGIEKYVIKALDGLREFLGKAKKALDDNEPSLRKVWRALQRVAEWIAEHVLPALGDLAAFLTGTVLAKGFTTAIGLVDTYVKSIEKMQRQLVNTLEAVRDLIAAINDIPVLPDIDVPGDDKWYPLEDPDWGAVPSRARAAPRARSAPSVVVQVDGSGIVDESKVARTVADTVRREVERMGGGGSVAWA